MKEFSDGFEIGKATPECKRKIEGEKVREDNGIYTEFCTSQKFDKFDGNRYMKL